MNRSTQAEGEAALLFLAKENRRVFLWNKTKMSEEAVFALTNVKKK